jgi:hypothetical protein
MTDGAKPKLVLVDQQSTETDVISQAELRNAARLQHAVWAAARAAVLAMEKIRIRVSHGAEIERGRWCYDKELKSIRRSQPFPIEQVVKKK